MAAEENEEDGNSHKHSQQQQPVKLSHKQFRRLLKKERRRQKRQEAAKQREQKELEEKWRIENDPILRAKLQAKERAEKKILLEEEEERKTQHHLWLEREAIAQERFRKKKEDEERKLREKLEQEERIKKEWEEEQKREKEREERKQKAIKEKEDALFRELDKPTTSEDNGVWHNPLAPPTNDVKSYGTEQDTVNCSFYLKTGACRFGDRCSRQHPKPSSSVTLMIPAMYNDIRLSQSMLDEADQDTSLEYDEKDAYENFKQFYEDTLPEFRKAGTVVQFKVCCNHEPHLRGNVYVQFASEEQCAKAYALFNARWYASKQLSCEFSPVTKWKSAICGLFQRNRCPRGKNCNFLHVYRNPGNEFNHRDDYSPNRTPFNSGRGSERSERGWRRDEWSRRRDLDRDRSRDRDWEQDRHRKRREREWDREREDDRSRHRRRSKERHDSRTSERRENREQRKRSYSSDEGSEREVQDKPLSERLSPSVDKNNDTVIRSEDGGHQLTSTEKSRNRKRKHHSSDKHKHRRKSKKKRKHRSERKKKKKRESESDSSSSESDSEGQ